MPGTYFTGNVEDVRRVTDSKRFRELYEPPKEIVLKNEMAELDEYTRQFISLSPLVMVGTVGSVSSKGDARGFVRIINNKTLLIPDRSGNNRLDTARNILDNPALGLLFIIPGVNEVLRVGGRGEITDDGSLLEPMSVNGKAPKTGIIVHVDRVYYNCARSLIRSKAWDPTSYLDRRAVPSPAQVTALRLDLDPDESNARYESTISDLYNNK